jgi:hypothetical protein
LRISAAIYAPSPPQWWPGTFVKVYDEVKTQDYQSNSIGIQEGILIDLCARQPATPRSLQRALSSLP